MVETEKYWLVGSRFSRSVAAFETVPCPREDEEGYIAGLARKEREQPLSRWKFVIHKIRFIHRHTS